MNKVFGLIDCAREPRLLGYVKSSPAHACLFAGRTDVTLEAVSPFLVDLYTNSQLAELWRSVGWGLAWGVIVHSSCDLQGLRKHFRNFLLAELPDARKVMFRFYDPRVLPSFLASSKPDELQEWFSKVNAFVVENEDGGASTYTFNGQALQVTR